MKVLIEGEVIEQHEEKMFIVKLDTGFGVQSIPVAKDKTIQKSEVPDRQKLVSRLSEAALYACEGGSGPCMGCSDCDEFDQAAADLREYDRIHK